MTLQELEVKLAMDAVPSYELNWEIAQAIGWTRYWSAMTIHLPPGETEDDSENATTTLPNFCGSIDGALTLARSWEEQLCILSVITDNICDIYPLKRCILFGCKEAIRLRRTRPAPVAPATTTTQENAVSTPAEGG